MSAILLQESSETKDQPLREDIRLLGRILGDTVRSQEGEAVFDIVERIRQTSIRFHREEDQGARKELEAILNSLSPPQTARVVRAYSFFSHLANIAEDQHHIRRTRAHALAGSAPREGTMAHALDEATKAGVTTQQLKEFFDGALVSPVLTAHPTEVQRKSILTVQMAVANLLAERDHGPMTPEEEETNLESLQRAVLTLWQTAILRTTKLAVTDEVANGLTFYDYTFLREMPRFYAQLEDHLRKTDPSWATTELPSFLRMGSWIGGDRDGNPFVTAPVLRQAMRMQSTRALQFYLDELHTLGSELSLSTRVIDVSEPLRQLAELARSLAAPQAGAVPPRHFRPLCAGRRDAADAGRAGGAAPRRGRRTALPDPGGVPRRPRHHRPLADRQWFGRTRQGPAAPPAALGGPVRFPSGQHRPAPELRRA